jgi:hypothetical protein
MAVVRLFGSVYQCGARLRGDSSDHSLLLD